MAEGREQRDSGAGAADAVADERGVPANDGAPGQRFTDATFREHLASAAMQQYIRSVIIARLLGSAPPGLVDDLVQQASLNALAAKARPRANRTLARHFRKNAAHEHWLDPEADVAVAPNPHPDETGDAAPEWVIAEWLRGAIAGDDRDQETYELLRYKADTEKSYAEVAEDHAMTEGALKSRVFAFRGKYEPRWRRRQRTILLWILLGAAAAVGVGLLVWWLLRPAMPVIGPDVEPVPVPTPTVTVTEPAPQNQALPPEPRKPNLP
jgi:DNA-directed RNA polymerase specialized sigma24 family protein